MSRVTGHVFSRETHPCGRLVLLTGIEGQEGVLEFITPSVSRKDRVYGCEVSMRTAEAACGCEAMTIFREASLMPYRKNNACTPTEALAIAKGIPMAPQITRANRGLCVHLRRVKALLKRRRVWHLIEDAEAWAMERVEKAPARNQRRTA